ncbi:hypothetical protein GCM10023178_77750 [Actinomadura luteofluorescens]
MDPGPRAVSDHVGSIAMDRRPGRIGRAGPGGPFAAWRRCSARQGVAEAAQRHPGRADGSKSDRSHVVL